MGTDACIRIHSLVVASLRTSGTNATAYPTLVQRAMRTVQTLCSSVLIVHISFKQLASCEYVTLVVIAYMSYTLH